VSEAEEVGRKEFERYFTKCGDSYFKRDLFIFGLPKTPLAEFKDVVFDVKQLDLQSADKLNGVEWKGRFSADCKVMRTYDEEYSAVRGWSDWKSGVGIPNAVLATYDLEKRQGQWKIDGKPPSESPEEKLRCNEIPK